MDWITQHLAQTLAILGIAFLAIEIGVLGFSTFFLFFIGVGLLVTAGLVSMDLVPATYTAALLSISVIALFTCIVLWKPLRRMQNQVDDKKVTNDLTGHAFKLEEDVSPNSSTVYRYSGIDWKLISSESIRAGSWVEVEEAQVGIFYIKAKADK